MIRLLFKALFWPVFLPFTALAWAAGKVRRPRLVLLVDLEGLHPHRALSGWLRNRNAGPSRRALRQALAKAAKDPRVELVRVRVAGLAGGWATLFELRQLLVDLRAAGKRVSAFVPSPDTRTLWLASAAAEVLVPPDATVMATGIGAEMTFFGGALERFGLDLEVVTAGAFKSAMEPFTRREPSPANREAIDALLDDLYGRLIADLAAGRGRPEAEIRAAFDGGPHLPEAARDRGLLDAIVAEEDLAERDDHHPKGARTAVKVADYGGPRRPWPRFRWRAPRLAVVEVRGNIRDGRHADDEPSGACTRAVCDALDAARQDKRVKGVLLHVDSPGGSATASEHMWRAVRKLAAEKPVVAWMGDVAASGGYYVACAAQAIVATPGTLTGSIGVISAKPVVARLLDRWGVNRVRFERGPQSTMFSPTRPFSEVERAALEASIQQTYQLFLRRVGEGRARAPETVDPVAQGRVWTGAQALEHGLVDALGDEWVAVARLAALAQVPVPEALRLVAPHRGLKQRIRARLGVALRSDELDLLLMAQAESVLAWCPLRLP